MALRPPQWRVLAVFTGNHRQDARPGVVGSEFGDLNGIEAEVALMYCCTLEEFRQRMLTWKPNLVYVNAGIQVKGTGDDASDIVLKPIAFAPATDGEAPTVVTPDDFAAMFKDVYVDTVYSDAIMSEAQANALRTAGVPNVVAWSDHQTGPALTAAVFGKAFFSTLRNPTATAPEAFALACHAAHVHCTSEVGGRQCAPALPRLHSDSEAELPDGRTIPDLQIAGLDLSEGLEAAVPGWADVRLLAPHSELRLLVCGQGSLIDAHRLSYLGEALRAVMVAELRTCRVSGVTACEQLPANLPDGCIAVRCYVHTSSGATTTVVLGGPAEVLQEQAIVQHALRKTLVADALTLQMKLPPQGVPAPVARASPTVAGGTPVVDVVALTSVWVVHILRHLAQARTTARHEFSSARAQRIAALTDPPIPLRAQDSSFRGLVTLGIGAVGGTAVAAFSANDSQLSKATVETSNTAAPASSMPPPHRPRSAPVGPASYNTQMAPPRPPGPAFDSNAGSVPPAPDPLPVKLEDVAPASRGKKRPEREPAGKLATGLSTSQTASSARPPLIRCSEGEFLDDVFRFLSVKRGKELDRATFPDVVLNGSQLDLFALYKETATRGGYKLGNGINWKAQIFPKMRNFTSNSASSVGNTVKRHYQVLLLDYEQEHPEDVTGGICGICAGGEDVAVDWISCDLCDTWVHFSCDPRAQQGQLGTYREHSGGDGRSFTCLRCNEVKRKSRKDK